MQNKYLGVTRTSLGYMRKTLSCLNFTILKILEKKNYQGFPQIKIWRLIPINVNVEEEHITTETYKVHSL